MLTLMMLFHLPPQKFLSAGTANDIRIHPDRRALVAISLGRRAARQHILINGNAVHGRPCAVTSGQWEITAGGQALCDAVVLSFEWGADRSWDNL